MKTPGSEGSGSGQRGPNVRGESQRFFMMSHKNRILIKKSLRTGPCGPADLQVLSVSKHFNLNIIKSDLMVLVLILDQSVLKLSEV